MLSVVGTLTRQRVLDIGANSGYYLFRMSSLNPTWVLGIDPEYRFKLQFETMQKYAQIPNLFFELLTLQSLEALPEFFDTVFCLGIVGHRRNPLAALSILRTCLREGGRLFLETLVLDSQEEMAFCPYPTYAKMNNVYFLPSISSLENWLKRTGFSSIELIHKGRTTTREQRNTPFCPLPAQSLEHFLDPDDDTRTIEGYPAPVRACWVVQ